jgi:large subunit ribosomal protein L6
MGAMPIVLADKVSLRMEGSTVIVEGPKGKLTWNLPEGIVLQREGNCIRFRNERKDKKGKVVYGLARALVNNMVIGVSRGFEKVLLIEGVGYRANMKGQMLELSLGYSHPVQFPVPPDVKVEVENQTLIRIKGIDKQKVGEVAAQIRRCRPPDPYKAKGIRYQDEVVRRKAGKQRA